LSDDSALSDLAASDPSDPPAACTFLASRMPRAGLVTMAGIAVLAVVLVSTTVSGLGAVAVMPVIRNDGLPSTFLVRISENTTSAAVTGSPLANFTPGRSATAASAGAPAGAAAAGGQPDRQGRGAARCQPAMRC
jgi:hypothetical protein